MSDVHESNSQEVKHTAKVTPLGAMARPGGDEHLERLATTFETSARRWEMVVYPAMFAFIVLAVYGFYLIFSLTTDVSSLARNVTVLTHSIDRMTVNMDGISGNMNVISSSMQAMDGKMNELEPIRMNMEQMNHSTRAMTVSVDGMRYQMGTINHNMRPLGQMGSFMPW